MDVKTAFSKVVKATRMGNLKFVCLVLLETILSIPSIKIFIPENILNKINYIITKIFTNDIVMEFYDCKFYIPDYSAWVVLNEQFEQEIYEILNHYCDTTTTFVDIGAHVGKYAITLSKKCKKVIAIEPDPQNFLYLKKNVSINKLNNIILYNVACYRYNGFIKFNNSVASPVRRIILQNGSNGIYVRTKTLDSIVKETNISSPLVIKIDVEGTEFDVLLGAKKTIDRFKPLIICEVWEQNKEKVLKLLSKYDYKFKILKTKRGKVQDFLFYYYSKNS